MTRIPSYRLHKASGQGTTKLRGKCYYFGPFDEPVSLQRYNELIARYILSNQSQVFGQSESQIVVAEAFNLYMAHAKEYYGATTTEYENLRRALNPLVLLIPRLPINDFGPVYFKEIRSWWLKRDVSRQYINAQMKRVRRLLKWLASEGKLIASNFEAIRCVAPLKAGRTTAKEAPAITSVDDAVVAATLPFLSPTVRDMVQVQRLTGCGPGEVCQIKPSMVDRSNEVWEIRMSSHKSAWRGKERSIFVGPKAQQVLGSYLDRPTDLYCFSPSESMEHHVKRHTSERVTPTNCGNTPGSNRVKRIRKSSRKPGEQFTTGTYGRAIAYACLKAFPAPTELEEAGVKIGTSQIE